MDLWKGEKRHKQTHTHTHTHTSLYNKVRWFNYGVGERADGTLEAHPDQVWYRLSLKSTEPWKKIPLKRRAGAVGTIDDAKFALHTAPLPLPRKKQLDLAKFRAWLPKEFHILYPDPPAHEEEDEDGEESDGNNDEDDDEKEDSEDEHEEEEEEVEQEQEEEEVEENHEKEEEEEEEEEEVEQDDGEDDDGDITMTQVVV
jgi:hypothetical protein